MPTTTHTVRIPDDLKAEADQAARDLRMSFSDYVRAALAEKLGKEPQRGAEGQAAIRAAVREAEAEAHSLRIRNGMLARQLAAATGQPADIPARPAVQALAEKRFAAAMEAAAPAEPATPFSLSLATGQDRNWCGRRLAILTASGHVTRIRKGEYVPVPGADIAAGLAEARGRVTELAAGAAQEARERAEAPAPQPAPREQAAAATATRNGRIGRARDKAAAAGAPLVAASDLPRPGAAVFQPAGEDKTVTEVPSGKPRGSRRARCPHRLPAGAWCKTCQQPK